MKKTLNFLKKLRCGCNVLSAIVFTNSLNPEVIMVLVLIRRDLKKESSAFIWFTLCPDITLMPFNDF